MRQKKNSLYLKIATLNLQNYLEPPNAYYDFEQIYSSEQWAKKQGWIKRYLDDNLPDVVGFQEVFSTESLKRLTMESGYQYFGVVDEPNVEDDFIFSNPVVAVASKYPIKAVANVNYDDQLAAKIGLSQNISFVKRVLRASIDIPHIGLTDFYIVHFKSQRSLLAGEYLSNLTEEQNFCEFFKAEIAGGWASSIVRGSEALLLQMEIMFRRESTNNPAVLIGDFNESLSTSTLKHLTQQHLFDRVFKHNQRLISKYALKDSWDLYVENGLTNKKLQDESIQPRESTHFFGGKGSVLDYILMSQEFDTRYDRSIYELVDHQTLNDHVVNPTFDIDGYSTDHAIVQVLLKLRH